MYPNCACNSPPNLPKPRAPLIQLWWHSQGFWENDGVSSVFSPWFRYVVPSSLTVTVRLASLLLSQKWSFAFFGSRSSLGSCTPRLQVRGEPRPGRTDVGGCGTNNKHHLVLGKMTHFWLAHVCMQARNKNLGLGQMPDEATAYFISGRHGEDVHLNPYSFSVPR